MKHKTLFRLALNVIGVLLIALALPELIKDVAGFIRTYRLQGSTAGWAAPMSMTEHLFWLTIAPLMQIGIGAYLLSGAPLVVDWIIPSNRPSCPDCGYDLSRSRSDTCSECGADVRSIVNKPTASET